jgi:hypothetical protein
LAASRVNVDLPIPGSPSMSTAWPRPEASSAAQPKDGLALTPTANEIN